MYSTVSIVVLLLTTCFTNVRCTSTFSVPGGPGPPGNYDDNPNYKLGDEKVFQWSSDLETMDLLIWQQYPTASATESYWVRIVQNQRYTSQPWTVSFDGFSTNFTPGTDAVFYLALYATGSNAWDTTSHYFNVTLPIASTSTASTETATTSSVSLSAGSAPTNTITTTAESTESATATSDSTDNKEDDSGLSTGAVAGIAVGATLGGVLALAGVVFILWRHFRKGASRGHYAPGQQAPPPVEEYKPELAGGGWNQTTPQQTYPHGSGYAQGGGYAHGPEGLHEVP